MKNFKLHHFERPFTGQYNNLVHNNFHVLHWYLWVGNPEIIPLSPSLASSQDETEASEPFSYSLSLENCPEVSGVMVLNKYLLWDWCFMLSSCFGERAQIPVLQLLNLFPREELWEVWLTLRVHRPRLNKTKTETQS